jgi:hypothetical protein
MDGLRCLSCDKELPDDNLLNRSALVLTDERQPIPAVLGTWCDEKCLGEWLTKAALSAMMRRMMRPSAN